MYIIKITGNHTTFLIQFWYVLKNTPEQINSKLYSKSYDYLY